MTTEKVIENKFYTQIISTVVAVSETIIVDRIDTVRPHCFAGVQFFADADGETIATPTAGEVQLSVSTVNSGNNGNVFENFTQDSMDLTNLCTRSWAANTTHVRAVPTGITGAAFYKLVVSCNTT